MIDQPIRAAVIGAGKIAELGHVPGYARAGAPVVALCDSSPERLARLADAHGIERRYTDWRQMLADGSFEAVSICTPPALHAEMALAALVAGYHVLVEKPMAVSLAQCDQMITAAEQSRCRLMVAHNQRFRAQHAAAKEVLDSGRLGSVRRAHAVFAHGGPEHWSPTGQWYFNPAVSGFGVLADLGYHKIDLLRWLLGQEVTDIQVFAATFEKPTALDDTAVALIQFVGGTLATVQVSWAHHPDVIDSLTIDCARGSLSVPSNFDEPVRIIEENPRGEVIETSIVCRSASGAGWFGAVAAFVTAIREDQPSPVPGSEGRATLAVVLRAYANLERKTQTDDETIS